MAALLYALRSGAFSGAGPDASTCLSAATASTSILSAMLAVMDFV
jgi:hypothetical protein